MNSGPWFGGAGTGEETAAGRADADHPDGTFPPLGPAAGLMHRL